MPDHVLGLVVENDVLLMGNTPISSKKMLALKPQRMVEIQHNENWNYEAPWGLRWAMPEYRREKRLGHSLGR